LSITTCLSFDTHLRLEHIEDVQRGATVDYDGGKLVELGRLI
jgi:hypothetical protein